MINFRTRDSPIPTGKMQYGKFLKKVSGLVNYYIAGEKNKKEQCRIYFSVMIKDVVR